MNKIVFRFFVIIILFCFNVKLEAQTEDTIIYKNEFRFGVYQSFLGASHINYERFLENNKSSFVGIFELIYNERQDINTYGYMCGLQYRYYLFTKISSISDVEIFKGYVSPCVKYREMQLIGNNYNDHIKSAGYEFLFGLKYLRFHRIIVDMNFGISVKDATVYAKTNPNKYTHIYGIGYGYSGVSLTANITCGFNF